jgi:uncharacterized membrane protein YgdD (TMEM256/DUF423 family)
MTKTSIAAFLLALGIGMGAFGAHGLRPLLEARSMDVYETAVFYLITQALGLLWVAGQDRPAAFRLLLSGILLFAGSLFLLSTRSLHALPVSWLGPLTPIGGLLMMAGWGAVVLQFWGRKNSKSSQ